MFDPLDKQRLDLEEAVRETFDRWSIEGLADGMERRHRDITEKLFARMAPQPDDRLLEIGCGDGWAARLVAPLALDGAVVGIDVSGEMIARARERSADLDNVLLAPGAAEEIPWAEDYFTHVYSIEAAYYFPDPDRAAREIFRVATYGGRFWILINFYAENAASHDWPAEVGLTMHLKSADEWVEIFRAAGFAEVAVDRIVDETSIPERYEGEALRRRQELQRNGGLLITGVKPGSPPRPPRAEPSAFPILG